MKRGQILVMLIIFAAISLTVAMTGAVISTTSVTNASRQDLGQIAIDIADSGVENALIRLLRDPTYTGETLTFSLGDTCITTITGSNPYTIISTSTVGRFSRKAQAVAQFTNGVMSVTSWQEVY